MSRPKFYRGMVHIPKIYQQMIDDLIPMPDTLSFTTDMCCGICRCKLTSLTGMRKVNGQRLCVTCYSYCYPGDAQVKTKTLSPEALAVLGSMETTGNLATIPSTTGQLDRALYLEVNKALEAIGGKWSKKVQAHVFEEDPRDALDRVVLTGMFTDTKQEFGFFETPKKIVEQMMVEAEIASGHHILEPSAGKGAIAEVLASYAGTSLVCVEAQPANVEVLIKLLIKPTPSLNEVHKGNFLDMDRSSLGYTFDRIVMNPPFAREQDAEHIIHAFTEFLVPRGRLVAICGAGVRFRQTKKTRALAELVKIYGKCIDLPPGSFKSSGTNVNTCMLVLNR